MKKNTRHVSGIIVTGENRIHIRTRPEFLIFDVRSYARELLVSQEDAIARLEHSDSQAHRTTREFLRQCATEIKLWLDTPRGASPTVQSLARRLRLEHGQVQISQLQAYLALVLSLSRVADAAAVPEFILHADKPSPVIFVNRRHRLLAAHTGQMILGVVESDEELADRVELATSAWSMRQ